MKALLARRRAEDDANEVANQDETGEAFGLNEASGAGEERPFGGSRRNQSESGSEDAAGDEWPFGDEGLAAADGGQEGNGPQSRQDESPFGPSSGAPRLPAQVEIGPLQDPLGAIEREAGGRGEPQEDRAVSAPAADALVRSAEPSSSGHRDGPAAITTDAAETPERPDVHPDGDGPDSRDLAGTAIDGRPLIAEALVGESSRRPANSGASTPVNSDAVTRHGAASQEAGHQGSPAVAREVDALEQQMGRFGGQMQDIQAGICHSLRAVSSSYASYQEAAALTDRIVGLVTQVGPTGRALGLAARTLEDLQLHLHDLCAHARNHVDRVQAAVDLLRESEA